ERRRYVLDTLVGAGVVRPLDQRVGVVAFVAPTDGMTNAISAAGLEQFTRDLCGRFEVPCQTSEVLG
ncbi:MAG: hypothetical protein N2037_07690, partial [Acidimicrobiales bacterium]|nr:hypothetical protein [Acidimicrobiales bacterium]